MESEILHFNPWCENSDFASVIVSTRFGGEPMAQPYIHFWRVRGQSLDYLRKAQRRLQSLYRRLARAELRTEQRLYIGELSYSPDNSVYAPSTNEGDESTNVTNCHGQVHQPQHNHGRTDHGLKKINHGNVIGNVLDGNIHKTSGTHQNTTIGGGFRGTFGSFTGDRWTQLTLLVNIMTHATFTLSNL